MPFISPPQRSSVLCNEQRTTGYESTITFHSWKPSSGNTSGTPLVHLSRHSFNYDETLNLNVIKGRYSTPISPPPLPFPNFLFRSRPCDFSMFPRVSVPLLPPLPSLSLYSTSFLYAHLQSAFQLFHSHRFSPLFLPRCNFSSTVRSLILFKLQVCTVFAGVAVSNDFLHFFRHASSSVVLRSFISFDI